MAKLDCKNCGKGRDQGKYLLTCNNCGLVLCNDCARDGERCPKCNWKGFIK